VVEHLPNKREALSSHSSTAKQEKKCSDISISLFKKNVLSRKHEFDYKSIGTRQLNYSKVRFGVRMKRHGTMSHFISFII
jgi:hypothetical protein